MTKKIPILKWRCSRCHSIKWSEEAMRKHIQQAHKKEKDRDDILWENFEEPELCPYVYPAEKKICSCSMPIAMSDTVHDISVPICPALIDNPFVVQRYRIRDLIPGIYIGKIEKIDMMGERVSFVILTNIDNKRFSFNGPKTIAFEILKRTVSKQLSVYAKNVDGSQRVWEGFSFVFERPDKLRMLFDRVVELDYTFSFNIHNGGIINEVRVVDKKREGEETV